MQQIPIDLNTAIYVGIDAHPTEHTALAMNRFEEEKGRLRFENTSEGINVFLSWLLAIDVRQDNIIVGIEGGSGTRNSLLSHLLETNCLVYEVNPLFTKQRRGYGTRADKSDPVDAKLVADVLTRKVAELPRITKAEISPQMLCLKKTVWFYEEITMQSTRLKNQLHQLRRERNLSSTRKEQRILDIVIQSKEKHLQQIKDGQKKLTGELAGLLKNNGENIMSVKGISVILAAKIVAHANGIKRYKNRDKFIRYAGISPIERSSGKSIKFIKNKRGNRKLHAAFYLAAVCQIRYNPKAKTYFEKKVNEGKTKKQALFCVMKRTASIVYGMLKNGEAYRD